MNNINKELKKLESYLRSSGRDISKISMLKKVYSNQNDSSNRPDEDIFPEDETTEFVVKDIRNQPNSSTQKDVSKYLEQFGLSYDHLPLIFLSMSEYLKSNKAIVASDFNFIQSDRWGNGPMWHVNTVNPNDATDKYEWSCYLLGPGDTDYYPDAPEDYNRSIPGTNIQFGCET